MSSMSYVRFENTYDDLLDCYENLDRPASKREHTYRMRLIDLCERIVRSTGFSGEHLPVEDEDGEEDE